MANDKFTIEVDEERFLIIKLYENDVEFSLYVLPYNNNQRGFFVTKNHEGKWEIFGRVIVAQSILKKEAQLLRAIIQNV